MTIPKINNNRFVSTVVSNNIKYSTGAFRYFLTKLNAPNDIVNVAIRNNLSWIDRIKIICNVNFFHKLVCIY